MTKVQPVLSPAKKDEERPLLVDRKEAKRLKRVFKRVLKRVEAKEAREQGLAFRNPNIRESNISNIRASIIPNNKDFNMSNTKEPNVSRR